MKTKSVSSILITVIFLGLVFIFFKFSFSRKEPIVIKNQPVEKFTLPEPLDLSYFKYEDDYVDTNLNPFIILHGVIDSKNSWIEFCKEITKKSNRICYAIDMRDHGESPHGRFDFKSIVSDLKRFFTKHNIEKSIVFGHSIGGIMLSRFCTLYPERIEKFIILDVNTAMNSETDEHIKQFLLKLLKIIKLVVNQLKKENLKDLESANERYYELINTQLPDMRIKSYLKINEDGEIDLEFSIDDLIDFLTNLDNLIKNDDINPYFEKDVLLIYATKSIIFNYKNDEISIRKQYPNVEFKKIIGANHTLHFDAKYRKILLEIVLDYIKN